MSAFLEIRDLGKSFGENQVLSGLCLDLAEGEILALLGLSGSGKTTALRLMAGFETPDTGTIRVGGEDVAQLPASRRGFGMVFQHYALFPHMMVAENIAFGLEAQGWEAGRAGRRIDEMLALVDLAGFGGRRVSEISGGQQQRVALARALAPEPRVLLLDEPLSNLDPSLRERTRQELRAAVKRIGITTVLVTHEQEEAFHVGDRVAVLHAGHLQQVGTPIELYDQPTTPFVSTFVGRASTLPGVLEEAGEECWVALEHLRQDGRVSWAAVAPSAVEPGAPVDLVVKPEGLTLVPSDRPGALPGTLAEIRFTGPLTYGRVEVATGSEVEVLLSKTKSPVDSPKVGDAVYLAPRAEGPKARVFARQGEPAGGPSP